MAPGTNPLPNPSGASQEGEIPEMMRRSVPQMVQVMETMDTTPVVGGVTQKEAPLMTQAQAKVPTVIAKSSNGSGECIVKPKEQEAPMDEVHIKTQGSKDTTISVVKPRQGIRSVKTDECIPDGLDVPEQLPPMERLEVVVAHYKEELGWLDPFLKHPDVKVSVYSKGGKNLTPKLHTHTTYLDNVGREGHTYLYHIVTRYDSLAHITLFCQGDPFDHFKVGYTPEEFLADALRTTRWDFATFRGQKIEKFDAWDGIKFEDYPLLRKWNDMKTKPAARTPAEYWELFMEPMGFKLPESIGFAPGANFAVTKHKILQYPRSFWAQVLSELFLGPMEDINPMTGHICERFWAAIMGRSDFIMYPGDTPHDIIHDITFGRLTKGNWKVLPMDPKDFIPSATPHDLAMALGIDTLDKEMAREMHEKGSIDMPSGEGPRAIMG